MNVKVKVSLCSTPNKKDRNQMYDAAEFLTNDAGSIHIYQSKSQKNTLVAEFFIDKARQIDVVDRIGKKFSYNVETYCESSISFPKTQSRKTLKISRRSP